MNGASSSSHEYYVSDSYARKASMMLSYEPWAQTSSYGCMRLEMPTTPEMFCAVTLRKPPKCPRSLKKEILVTLHWLAICPCPRLVFWFGYVTLLSQLKCCLHYGNLFFGYFDPKHIFFDNKNK